MSIRQIARNVGISSAAVSLALRQSPKISAATQRAVRAEAVRLGYLPDAKLREMMSHLRQSRGKPREACLGVISFYDTPEPWLRSEHLLRIYRAMSERADALGYRLEPFHLRSPGMTYRRIRGILDARGIQGLLSFGSPDLDTKFPQELDHFAVVTIGLSVATPLHRITSHFYNDLTHALDRLKALGYSRPGLVLGEYEHQRSAHAYSSAYLGWCADTYGKPDPVPILRLQRAEEAPFVDWLRSHQPDVIIFVHLYHLMREFQQILVRNRIRVPRDLGVIALTQILEGTGFAGMQQNQRLIGEWAVEMVVARILNHDLRLPNSPRIEMVESHWVPGPSLRKRAPASRAPARSKRPRS